MSITYCFKARPGGVSVCVCVCVGGGGGLGLRWGLILITQAGPSGALDSIVLLGTANKKNVGLILRWFHWFNLNEAKCERNQAPEKRENRKKEEECFDPSPVVIHQGVFDLTTGSPPTSLPPPTLATVQPLGRRTSSNMKQPSPRNGALEKCWGPFHRFFFFFFVRVCVCVCTFPPAKGGAHTPTCPPYSTKWESYSRRWKKHT